MIRGILILTVFLGFTIIARAQNCNCDHTITTEQLSIDGSSLNILPGDTICLEAGTKRYLRLVNFHGNVNKNIVFINCGGAVVIQNNDMTYGVKIGNSSYFRFTGTGDSSIPYGIKVLGTKLGASGVGVDDLSTNFEVDHLEVANTGFAGIMTKNDPQCDLSSNRDNFVQYQTIIHDNYIHDTGGEGLYIGHSFYSGYSTTCNGLQVTLMPHSLVGVRVYNNIVENSHWDGIQVGSATEDCEIYGNRVNNYGVDSEAGQNNGIQIGGGTTGKCYNNYIANGTGNGIIIMGLGNNDFYNNVIVNAGLNYFPTDPAKRVHGIFCDDRSTIPESSFNFYNNTIINPKTDGIRFMSTQSLNNKFYNNIIINPGSLGSYSPYSKETSYINVGTKTGISSIQSNNYFYKNMSNVLFLDTLTNNYRLTSASPAIDAGLNLADYGINTDFDSISRPYGSNFDIGAFEYMPPCSEVTGGTASGTAFFCVSGTPTVSANGYSRGTGSKYQWQYSYDNFAGEAFDFAGQKNPIKLTTGIISATTYYRLKVTCPAKSTTAYSNAVTITVNANKVASVKISVSENPVCEETPVTFTAIPTNGGSTPSYQWQKDGTDIISEKNAIYVSNTLADNDVITVLMISNATPCLTESSATSNSITATVVPKTVGGQLSGIGSLTYGSATGVMTLSGNTGSILKWQKMFENGSWIDIPDMLKTYSEIPSSAGNWQYRVVVKNGICSETFSSPFKVIVSPKELTVSGAIAMDKIIDGNTIAQITGATLVGVLPNDDVNLANHTTGIFAQTDIGTEIPVSTLPMTIEGADIGNYILIQPTGLKASIIPHCTNPSNGGIIAADQTLCYGQDAALIEGKVLPVGQSGVLEYKWQSSFDNINFSDIGSITTVSYDPGMLTGSTWYKRLARVSCKSGWTDAAESNVVKITVNPMPDAAGLITGPTTVVAGTSSVGYSVLPIANATSYLWYYTGSGVTITGRNNNVTVDFSSNATSGQLTVKGNNACGNGVESTPITVKVYINQVINLSVGWNIVSANVIPDNLNLKDIFQTLIDSGKLKKVMDETGKTIENLASYGGWINNIGNLNSSKGYKVYVTAACSLSIVGVPVQLPMDINLAAGWNIISYPYTTLLDGEPVVQPLINFAKLIKVMDESGKTIENYVLFGGWKNNIGNFAPGKGYKVYIGSVYILTFSPVTSNLAPYIP